MKYMIDRTALTNLVMVADLRNEIRTTVPSDLIRSGFAAESFIDGNNINSFIQFYIHNFDLFSYVWRKFISKVFIIFNSKK